MTDQGSNSRAALGFDAAQQVILGDAIVEVELIEQLALLASPPPMIGDAGLVDWTPPM